MVVFAATVFLEAGLFPGFFRSDFGHGHRFLTGVIPVEVVRHYRKEMNYAQVPCDRVT